MFNNIRNKRKFRKLVDQFSFVETNYGIHKYDMYDSNLKLKYRALVYNNTVTFYSSDGKWIPIKGKSFMKKFVNRLESPYRSKSIYR